ncbi:MAG: RsmB/NOP family class I SAM-dependent RNA methyltransferase [Pseudonocardia sp.]
MTVPRRPRRPQSQRDRSNGPRGAGPPRGREGPPRPPEVDPSRLAALELLTAVRVRDAYANLALPAILRRHRLHDRDAALATELGYGTLRAQGLLNAVIEACADRPLIRVEAPLLDALRLGTYQLLRTRIPAHAAVDTTVELVRADGGSRAAGFVNAILRKVGERDEAGWVGELAPSAQDDPVGHAAFAHAHPRWIAQAFVDALQCTAEVDSALAADDARPTVHLLARPGEITAQELAAVTGGDEAPYSPYGVHLPPGSGEIGELDVISEGLAVVQDEGSQLVAIALARAGLDGLDGGRWLDLCAGPGGKAVLLGGLAALDGAALDAVECNASRADLVRRAVDGLPVTVHTADGRDAPLPDGVFDRVLLDAPCTGLGALRRRPEARWRRRPEDVSGLAKLQRELLTAALRHVRPGGVVAYVTCSPHLSETVGVVGRAVRRADVVQVDARSLLPGVPDLGDGPAVQLWPHRHGTDAMFLAVLRRTE